MPIYETSVYDEWGVRRRDFGLADLFVTVPGQTFRYGHDAREHAPDDVCVAVCFKSDAHDEIGAFDVEALARRTPVVPLDNRRAYLRRRLLAHLSGPADSLAIDPLSGELLAATVAGTTSRLHRPAQLEWYARRIDAARRALDENYAADYTLSRLAGGAGMSPYHFARVFRELAGAPPHRYLLHRRLQAAADRLRAGATVTDTC